MSGIRTLEDLRVRCRIDAETGCWLWGLAVFAGDGCPRMRSLHPQRGKASSMRGTQCAWLLSGKAVPEGHGVYLTCKARTCCNPEHMQCWTRAQWGAWMRETGVLRNRPDLDAKKARGNRLPQAKLTREKVRIIRASTKTGVALAAEHGVSMDTISKARRGLTWREELPQASVFAWARAA